MPPIFQNIEASRAEALERWHWPHPGFASGRDRRSSESGLLKLYYGGMEHAARYGWLNGGRTLIDKTYLSILWAAQGLDRPSISFEQLASNLDRFIRQELSECWGQLPEQDHESRHRLAITLVETAAQSLFGSQRNETAASHILFFLCPQLPIFPYGLDYCRAAASFSLSSALPEQSINGYAHYHRACRQLLASTLPLMGQAPRFKPKTEQPDLSINDLLTLGDWWPRRLLAQLLTKDIPASFGTGCAVDYSLAAG